VRRLLNLTSLNSLPRYCCLSYLPKADSILSHSARFAYLLAASHYSPSQDLLLLRRRVTQRQTNVSNRPLLRDKFSIHTILTVILPYRVEPVFHQFAPPRLEGVRNCVIVGSPCGLLGYPDLRLLFRDTLSALHVGHEQLARNYADFAENFPMILLTFNSELVRLHVIANLPKGEDAKLRACGVLRILWRPSYRVSYREKGVISMKKWFLGLVSAAAVAAVTVFAFGSFGFTTSQAATAAVSSPTTGQTSPDIIVRPIWD